MKCSLRRWLSLRWCSVSETAHDIIAKTEGIVRAVVDLGHLCSLRRWHEGLFCAMIFQCDAARWLPDQQRYGHIFHVRQAVGDEQLARARDPQFLLADTAYYTVRDALSELDLWVEAEAHRRKTMTSPR